MYGYFFAAVLAMLFFSGIEVASRGGELDRDGVQRERTVVQSDDSVNPMCCDPEAPIPPDKP